MELKIDGKKVSVPAGTTIWEAARRAGVNIPVLCHSPKLDPVGVCRLCVVDVGERAYPAACVRECEPDMNVSAMSPELEQHRKTLTRLLLSDHPIPCEKDKNFMAL